MTNNDLSLERGGIHFFAAISASMTHDMKNVMAIINENAGLLTDLSAKAQKTNQAMDSRRVVIVGERIRKQIARADQMIKQFNRFSHSLDPAEKYVDIEEAILLIVGVAGRIFDQHGISVTVISPRDPCKIETHRFPFLHLIFRTIEILCEAMNKGTTDNIQKNVTISLGQDSGKPTICFFLEPENNLCPESLFSRPKDRSLLANINMDIRKNIPGNGFCLYMIETDH